MSGHLLSRVVADALVDEVRRLRDDFLKHYPILRSSSTNTADRDLASPYLSTSHNLNDVKVHVQRVHGEWQVAVALQKKALEGKGSSDPRTRAIQKTAQHFARRPEVLSFSDEELKIIMASYAYNLSGVFGFSVAFADLCAIKARVQSGVLFADRFAEVMCLQANGILWTSSNSATAITSVLYPHDRTTSGKAQGLRFGRQYFLSAASLTDIVKTITEFLQYVSMQLNYTLLKSHPILVPELIRLLVDKEGDL
ncbi:uncharacterized protein F5147DRAFT_813455 [Suillus discolor]|uniref:Alpha-1,4 glucan phosphorylase n=1 Tax=Suillus discolor TaxID=1912936 RepID=A0A9P7JQJ0_9AGAM|nr:uncharacterized protein F5147DRAFT_813455 [Suillus discolor]KAG2100218.1 hypothetical protein F5147DRAFT_813455 [Suillus discolor]